MAKFSKSFLNGTKDGASVRKTISDAVTEQINVT